MACWRLGAQRHLASRLAPLITKLWLPPPCLQADSELDKQRRAEWRPGCYVRVHGHISNFGGLLLALLTSAGVVAFLSAYALHVVRN